MFGMIASVAGPLISGIMGSNSADKASQAQQQADAAAIEEQRRQYDLNRADLAPFREQGSAAVTRLGQLMGLSGSGTGAVRAPAATGESREAIRARLLPQFSTPSTANEYDGGVENETRQLLIKARNPQKYGGAPVVNEAALNAAVDAELARAAAARQPAPLTGQSSYQMFGNSPLLRRFTVGDFWADPVTQLGLQFGLDEGTKGIDRSAASRGMLHSGSRLKALTRFGTDYTGTKAGESYNRFVGDQTNVYNRLAGLAGTGQTAATTTANMGQGTANNIAQLLSSGGNARGAAAIAGGNALGGAGTSIANYFNQQNLLDRIAPRPTGYSSFPSSFGYDSGGGPAYG